MNTAMRNLTLTGLCLLILISAVPMLEAAGPFFPRRTIYNYGGRLSPAVFYGNRWGGYGGGYYGGGYYDGGAAAIRAQGQAQVDRSKAMINYQEATSKQLDNQKKMAETYVARQKAQRASIAEQQEIIKAKDEARQAANERQTEKNRKRRESGLNPYFNASSSQDREMLSSSQLNPATGEISWPESLMGDEFQASRQKLQELYSLRNSTGVTSSLSRQISQEANEMKSLLRGQIRNMLPNDYLAARGFIEGLINMGKTSVTG